MNLVAAGSELARNAYKHAHGAGVEGGVLRIVPPRCRRPPPSLHRRSFGTHLPAGFDRLASEDLGLMIACTTAHQFGGEVRAGSDGGACFALLLSICHLPI